MGRWNTDCKSSIRREQKVAGTVPDMRIDIRKNFHPMSILITQSALKRLAGGQVLEVLCADERTRDDLLHIVRKSACDKLLGIWNEGSYCRILISRVEKEYGTNAR